MHHRRHRGGLGPFFARRAVQRVARAKKRSKSRIGKALGAVLGLGFGAVVGVGYGAASDDGAAPLAKPVSGNAQTLLHHYLGWRAGSAKERVFRFPLAWSKGRSAERVAGRGEVVVDPERGTLDVAVRGLGGHDFVDAWIHPFEPGDSRALMRGARDAVPQRIASIALKAGEGARRVLLADALRGLELDRVAITRSGERPAAGGLLFGEPDLFQRMFYRERAGVADGLEVGGIGSSSLKAASAVSWSAARLEGLVGLGETIFFRERFRGNGRTCGTCHPAANNFTIDPDFIATLAPNDPLFVAEFNPALNSDLNGGLVFENPTLMRRFGLIVENLDGFGDLTNRFVMRGVQHVLGLGTSIEPIPNLNQPLTHLTGFGGDGAPASGSLRDFSVGAVRQHFPRTLARVAGQDFRLPNTLELNALEAFMLSLGRRDDPDLATLSFVDPQVANGEQLFGVVGCAFCHRDAGATGSFGFGAGTFNVNTGVEAHVQNHPDGTGEPRPIDGGFGTNPNGDFSSLAVNPDGSYGDLSFNTQSLVELADTLPAFHGNNTANPNSGLADTVEGAIEFYNSQEFKDSGAFGTFGINMTATEVEAIGGFLRVINALENQRAATELALRARDELNGALPDLVRVTKLVSLAAEESEDAGRVLEQVGLHPGAQDEFREAERQLREARSGSVATRLEAVTDALARLASSRARMVR